MITEYYGSIFTTVADAIVIPVNTVGVMGKGLALDARRMNKQMFERYKEACAMHSLKVGNIMYYKDDTDQKVWILIPTKRHYKEMSSIEFIEAGLYKFTISYETHGIKSAAFPKLGCGLGRLDWERDVKPIMYKYLGPLSIPIYVYI